MLTPLVLLALAGCRSADVLVFDDDVWFALTPFGWLRAAVLAAFALVLWVGGLGFVGACGWAAVSPGTPRGDRVRSVVWAVGVGAGVWWIAGHGGRATMARYLASDQDFAAVRVVGDALVLIDGRRRESWRDASTLADVHLDCHGAEDTGEETWTCERTTELLWSDGTRSRASDATAGWHGCGRATARLEEQARALLAAAGRPGASVTVTGDCGR